METTGARHKSACTEGFHGYCAHTSKRFFGFKAQKRTDSLEHSQLTGHREVAAGGHSGAVAHHSPLGGLNLQPLPRLNQEGEASGGGGVHTHRARGSPETCWVSCSFVSREPGPSSSTRRGHHLRGQQPSHTYDVTRV